VHVFELRRMLEFRAVYGLWCRPALLSFGVRALAVPPLLFSVSAHRRDVYGPPGTLSLCGARRGST
jgi:hypothetical protein